MTGAEGRGPATDPTWLRQAFKPGTVDADAVEQMVHILDLQDAMPGVERLRSWALDRAALRAGERALDVGSGTGAVTRRLADGVGPGGSALGVEPNGMLRAVAEDRAAASGSSARFCQGLATELPVEDASVDVVWCERVLQHLPDAAAAIAEIARVLAPGGRALLLDADHGSRVVSDMDPAVAHALDVAFLGLTPNATAARHVPRQAALAGLEVEPDVGSSAIVFPQELLVDWPLLRAVADQAVADGLVTRTRVDDALRSLSDAARHGWAFSAVAMFAFVCHKV